VAGRYQPLADDVTIAGDIRPNLASAVDSEDEAKRAFASALRFGYCAEALGGNCRRACCLCCRKSSSFARDFHLFRFSNGTQWSDLSMESRR
jgi:hypothetical protein